MNSKGFSLVELALGMGLVGGIGLMIVTQSSNEMKFRRVSVGESKAADLSLLVQTMLEDPVACRETLMGKKAEEDTFTEVKNNTGTPVYEKNKNYEGITIDSFALKTGVNNGTYVIPDAPGFTTFELVVYPGTEKKELFLKRFPVWVEVDSAGLIENCSSLNIYLSNYWMRSYLNADNIFYQAGRVGMGSPTPVDVLDVGGQFRSEGLASDGLVVGGNQTDTYQLTVTTDRTLAIKSPAGEGDLIVRGLVATQEVRPGPLGDCLSNGDEGNLRYNSSINRLQVCVAGISGVQWIFFLGPTE